MKTTPTMHPSFKETQDGYVGIVKFKGNKWANGPYVFSKVFKTQREATQYAGNALFEFHETNKQVSADKLQEMVLKFLREYEKFN